jgi:hypothetical protein
MAGAVVLPAAARRRCLRRDSGRRLGQRPCAPVRACQEGSQERQEPQSAPGLSERRALCCHFSQVGVGFNGNASAAELDLEANILGTHRTASGWLQAHP